MCSPPRWDLGVCCRRKVHCPTSPRKDSFLGLISGSPLQALCRGVVLVPLSFLHSGGFIKHAGGSHASGNQWKEMEQLWIPCGPKSSLLKDESKQRIAWKLHLLFPQSLLIRRKDWWKRKIIMWDKILRQALCTKSLPCFQTLSWQCYSFHCYKAWASAGCSVIQTAAGQLNGEISWISFIRVSCLSGTLAETLPLVGFASQRRSTWGDLQGRLAVCAALSHTASSLFIGCLQKAAVCS